MANKKETNKPVMLGENGERDSKGRFIAGNKGGGRKALPDEVKIMLQGATVEAVRLLINTMRDPDVKPELRVKCAETIMDRVYGKSTQFIDSDLSGGIVIKLTGDVADYAA